MKSSCFGHNFVLKNCAGLIAKSCKNKEGAKYCNKLFKKFTNWAYLKVFLTDPSTL